MRSSRVHKLGFSLVEVTLALGIAAFCLLAVVGLLPVGVQSNQAAFSQTAATSILSNVGADMRAAGTSASSPQYGVSFNERTDCYFNDVGECSSDLSGTLNCNPGAPPWSPAIQVRYHAVITIPSTTTYATCANIKICWPAMVDPTLEASRPAGIVETVAAFDRQ